METAKKKIQQQQQHGDHVNAFLCKQNEKNASSKF